MHLSARPHLLLFFNTHRNLREKKKKLERERSERQRHPLPTGTHGYHCVLWSLAFQQLMESTCMSLCPTSFPLRNTWTPWMRSRDGMVSASGGTPSDHPMHLTQKLSVLCSGYFRVCVFFYWLNSYQMTFWFVCHWIWFWFISVIFSYKKYIYINYTKKSFGLVQSSV